MKYLVPLVLLSSMVACGGEEPQRDLPEPAFHAVKSFTTERYLRDDQIAVGAMTASQKALADQLLGIRKTEETVATAPAPRPVAKKRRRVIETYADDASADLEPEAGVLSDFEFQDAIQAWSGMRRCIAEATTRSDERSGALRVSFRIGGDGAVRACKVVDTSNAVAAAIAPCVERNARRIQFPAYGGDEMTKEAKFVF